MCQDSAGATDYLRPAAFEMADELAAARLPLFPRYRSAQSRDGWPTLRMCAVTSLEGHTGTTVLVSSDTDEA